MCSEHEFAHDVRASGKGAFATHRELCFSRSMPTMPPPDARKDARAYSKRAWMRAFLLKRWAQVSDLSVVGNAPVSRQVVLGGKLARVGGAPDDPYFRSVRTHAASLGRFARFASRHLDASSTVIDVGANIGLSTIILARRTERVIAFEPSPVNARYLRANLERNNLSNVEVVEAAASNVAGSLDFHVAKFGAGSHVVGPGYASTSGASTIAVPAIPLDDLDPGPISLVKIDAEGHEPDVLAGARALLVRDKPLIFTEINIWCLCAFAGHSPGALVRRLWQAFDVNEVGDDGDLRPLPDMYGFLHDTIVNRRGIADIVLRPKDGASMPSLRELTWPETALRELEPAPPCTDPQPSPRLARTGPRPRTEP